MPSPIGSIKPNPVAAACWSAFQHLLYSPVCLDSGTLKPFCTSVGIQVCRPSLHFQMLAITLRFGQAKSRICERFCRSFCPSIARSYSPAEWQPQAICFAKIMFIKELCLQVTAGQTLYMCDGQTGQTVVKHLHSPLPGNIHWEVGRSTQPLQVEGSQDGRLVFLAGSDGAVVAIDPRCPISSFLTAISLLSS